MFPPDSELKDMDYIFLICFPRAKHNTWQEVGVNGYFVLKNQISFVKIEVVGKDWTLSAVVSGSSVLSSNAF